MPDQNAAFVGTIPENYDRYLGPMLFEPYVEDMAQRVQALNPQAVLELRVRNRDRDQTPASGAAVRSPPRCKRPEQRHAWLCQGQIRTRR